MKLHMDVIRWWGAIKTVILLIHSFIHLIPGISKDPPQSDDLLIGEKRKKKKSIFRRNKKIKDHFS
jgi:hypothetical protein